LQHSQLACGASLLRYKNNKNRTKFAAFAAAKQLLASQAARIIKKSKD